MIVGGNALEAAVFMDDMALDADVRLHFHQPVAYAFSQNGHVSAILTAGANGLMRVEGKVFIDCTGDGTLSALAGAEYELSQELQPASLNSVLVNVQPRDKDTAALAEDYRRRDETAQEASRQAKVVRETLADRKARRENSRVDLLSFVHAFAPEVSDLFGCSAALSRALNLEEGDELISVRETDGTRKILIATHDGMAVCFDENDVRVMGRDAYGVRGIKLRDGDWVVGAARARAGKTVLSITENGYGKRTPVEEYRITNRGGLGIKNYMVTDKTGPVVGIKVVDGSEDLLLVTQAGILIRTPVENIRVAGRATQGVIVMRFKEEGDKVISLALTEHEEEDGPAEGVE